MAATQTTVVPVRRSTLSPTLVLIAGWIVPGLGHLLFEAVSNHDFPLMQALFLVLTVGMLTAIFIVDLLYARIDPRVVRS